MGPNVRITQHSIVYLWWIFFASPLVAAAADHTTALSALGSVTDVAIIDRVVNASRPIVDAYLLIEYPESSGQRTGQYTVQQYPAQFMAFPENSERLSEANRFLLGAKIPWDLLEILPDPFRLIFVVHDAEGGIIESPVTVTSKSLVQDGSKDPQALLLGIETVRAQIEELGKQLNTLEMELRPLREQAAAVAKVDDIIDLKMKLTRLQGLEEQNTEEIKRLKELVLLGRAESEPSDIYERLHLLSVDLQETARVTAVADRLARRRQQAAVVELQQKLGLVREMREYNRETLAREVLFLRKKRKALEAQLGISAPENSEDF